ncbi:MAG: sulfurtransferase [Pseudomonadota bacterium]
MLDPDPSQQLSAADALAVTGLRFIDVRKAPARAASGRTVAGAEWHDPLSLGHADPLVTAEGPIAVFCVHGHEVSQYVCALLRLHGRDAHYVIGGYEALVAAGAPTAPLTEDGA